MQTTALSLLTNWRSFYAIIGSSAATLTGLTFVVITFTARNRDRKPSEGVSAFATPNVVHFCSALLVAAILSAPWTILWNAGLLLGLTGLGGIIYVVVIVQRMRHHGSYKPVLEDWLWHTIFPLASYIALVVATLVLLSYAELALFIIGAVTVLLLFIGIHNSWDSVTYMAIERSQPENKSED